MTPAQVDRAQSLLRDRCSLNSWLQDRSLHYRAVITLHAPRSGPGNDRDSVGIDIPMEEAVKYIQRRYDEIGEELRSLGVEL